MENTEIPNKYSSEKETKGTAFEKEVVPGKRIGGIILGESAKVVLDSLGKPDSGDAAMGKAILTWKKNNMDILALYTETQMGVADVSRIKAIRSLSKYFTTADNLGVSSAIGDLKRYYRLDPAGKFTFSGKHYFLYTTDKGIGFEIGMDQKCHGVLLYPKNTDPKNFYLAFYPDLKDL